MSMTVKVLGKIKAILLWICTSVVFIPILVILFNSLKSQGEALAMRLTLPTEFHFENYAIVMEQANIGRALWNSLFISVSTVAISIVLGSMASYILARRRTKLNKKIYMYFLIGLIAPLNMVTAVLTLKQMHLMNSQIGLIFLYSALVLPFTVFLYYGFINTVPRELDEAAIIDGCRSFRLFGSIVFPLLKPVTVTVGILNFMNAWNDFITPFYIINSSAKMPMTTLVFSLFGQFQRSWNLVSAMMLLIILPIVIVYLLGQKYITAGMVAGAVKG